MHAREHRRRLPCRFRPGHPTPLTPARGRRRLAGHGQRDAGRRRDGREPRHRQAVSAPISRAPATTSSARRGRRTRRARSCRARSRRRRRSSRRPGGAPCRSRSTSRTKPAVAALAERVYRDVGPLRSPDQQRGRRAAAARARRLDQALAARRRRQPERPLLRDVPLLPAHGGGRRRARHQRLVGRRGHAVVRARELHGDEARARGAHGVARARPRGSRRGELHPDRHADLDRGLRRDAAGRLRSLLVRGRRRS